MKYQHLLPLIALIALAGCFSLARETPEDAQFVLGAHPMPDTTITHNEHGDVYLGFRQIRIADYLDSPLIVVRSGRHQVEYSEFNRWGGTLGGGISRAVAGYTEALLPLAVVDVAPWSPAAEHDFLIQIQVMRFEGIAPRGAVHVRASWEIISPQDGTVIIRGSTDFQEGNWPLGNYAALVDLLDAGLWKLSRDIVAGLTDLGDSSSPH